MNIFKKVVDKFKARKKTNFKSLLIKLRAAFKLKTWKSGVLALFILVVLAGGAFFVVYGQGGSTNAGPSLTKGLIAHYTLDAQDYEEGTTNIFPRNYNSLAFGSAYNGSSYSFNSTTNIQQVVDNTLKPDSNSAVTKVSRIVGDMKQADYVHIGLTSTLNSTRVVSFWYYGTYGSLIRPYNNDASASLYYLDDSGSWVGGSTSISIPVPINKWKKIVIKIVNRGVISGTGFSWFVMHSDNVSTTLSNQEYWAFTEFQYEENNHATPYVIGTRQDRVVDKTPYSNHGTNYGAISTIDRLGREGGAMSFDGLSNRISINYPNPVKETSVVAWFKKSGSPAGGYHIIVGGSYVELSIPDSAGQIRTGVTTNTEGRKVFNSGSGLTNGEWHQVALTYDGSNLKSFIDGQNTATNSVSGNLVGTATEIGRYLSNSYVTNGSIDD
ncbi:MAG: LamG domain-containing protein, partial [Bacteroidales bacterium]|nr:LamG domain-containing protein [Bacteroidales bacterium]